MEKSSGGHFENVVTIVNLSTRGQSYVQISTKKRLKPVVLLIITVCDYIKAEL